MTCRWIEPRCSRAASLRGAGAVINGARVRPGSSVVVIGSGGVGLNAIQGARLAGANPIIAVDILERKLAAAREFGATHTVDARDVEVVAAVKELTSGRGADYALVTVGSETAVAQAFALIRPGGTAVIVGLPRLGATVTLDIHHIDGERRVMGSPMGSSRLNVDVPRFADLSVRGASSWTSSSRPAIPWKPLTRPSW